MGEVQRIMYVHLPAAWNCMLCYLFAFGFAIASIWQHKPKTMRVRVDGKLGSGVTAKDIILSIIAKIGTGGGTGHVIEYAGATVTAMSMEARMTVCNMSIEAGARAGMVAPDDLTFAYMVDRRQPAPGFPDLPARAY